MSRVVVITQDSRIYTAPRFLSDPSGARLEASDDEPIQVWSVRQETWLAHRVGGTYKIGAPRALTIPWTNVREVATL